MSDFLSGLGPERGHFFQDIEEPEHEMVPKITQEQQSQQLFQSQQQQQKPVEPQKTVSTEDDLLEYLKLMDKKTTDVVCYECLCNQCVCSK